MSECKKFHGPVALCRSMFVGNGALRDFPSAQPWHTSISAADEKVDETVKPLTATMRAIFLIV